MKNLKRKQLVKIASLSAPIIALVIATIFGLDMDAQGQIQEIILSIVAVVAGAIGVGGVISNNDKNSKPADPNDKTHL